MPQNKRVLVAMSGGVDSSVTAYLLREAGYECEGATMRLTCSREFGEAGPRSCCSLQDIADAQAVCERLGIPHRVLDMREAFERAVVDKFVDTYEDGRTPNPCIDCNRYLKFGALLDYALAHGFDHIATGHYARIGASPRAIDVLVNNFDTGIGFLKSTVKANIIRDKKRCDFPLHILDLPLQKNW